MDGRIIGDGMPDRRGDRTGVRRGASQGRDNGKRKPSMSFGTSFSLSLKNLITKGRTALTSFAGSIGIIASR